MIWLSSCPAACAEKDQYACREDGTRAFEVVEELFDDSGKIFELRCGNCGELDYLNEEEWGEACRAMDARAKRRCKVTLTRYPYVEPHTGEVVHSAAHREEVVKRYGLHAAEHGIDERFNDELADKLKDRERDRKDRLKKARREIRAALGSKL